MDAVAVILAAGAPRSLEHPKALLQHDAGKSFLQSLASTFGKAGCRVLGVVGHEAERVRAQHPAIELVEAERWAEGVLASAQAGVRTALAAGAELVLLHPVDMPAVRASTIKSLLKKAETGTGVRPEFEGAPGSPLVLTRGGAEGLLEASDERLDAALDRLELRRIAVKDPGVVVNIHTKEIYERLFGTAPKLAPPPKRRGKREPEPQHVD
jgi:molybdenum cofactor cytidylyltransferase